MKAINTLPTLDELFAECLPAAPPPPVVKKTVKVQRQAMALGLALHFGDSPTA